MRMFACLGQVNPSYKNQWMSMFFLPTNRFGAARITLWAHEEFNRSDHFNLENCSFTGALKPAAWFFWWIFIFPLWVGGGAKQMDLIYLSLPSEGCDIFQETRNYIIACIYIKSGKLVSSFTNAWCISLHHCKIYCGSYGRRQFRSLVSFVLLVMKYRRPHISSILIITSRLITQPSIPPQSEKGFKLGSRITLPL